ncbi:MAG: STAS domain-containing protein [Planctomycetes bacterium]|jgi:anti-anti-sigma factor|nr:STAS domain-containing protein [Planctomycetota bacterium]MCP4840057.1 STAS domain-containing protein [Planctomycetota bacterium]
MKMQWEHHRSGTVLSLSGEFVSEDTDVLRRRCEERLETGTRLIIDLRELDRIDSAGLEALLWLQESLHRLAGQLRLVRGEGQVAAALHVTRIDRQLSAHGTLETAARSFARGQAA